MQVLELEVPFSIPRFTICSETSCPDEANINKTFTYIMRHFRKELIMQASLFGHNLVIGMSCGARIYTAAAWRFLNKQTLEVSKLYLELLCHLSQATVADMSEDSLDRGGYVQPSGD